MLNQLKKGSSQCRGLLFCTKIFVLLMAFSRAGSQVISGLQAFPNINEGDNSFTGPQTPLAESLKSSYDYIIVGAGSAGSVLAARLSENPSRTVLLVEAGPDDRGRPELTVPMSGLYTFGSALDWSYTTKPNFKYSGLDEFKNIWRGGRVVGGTSSINAMIYCRGSPYDFNRWADYTGDETWNYRHVLSYFKKVENVQGSLRDSPNRGTSGPLTVSRQPSVPFADFFLKATEEAGFTRNSDYNGGRMLGSGYLQHTVLDGERMSASRAYLWPVLARPNLDVVVNTVATRVVIKNGCAVGVELTQGQGQTGSQNLKFMVKAEAEVILSAGAVGSPKLLMLSGVGPSEHLTGRGIPVVADLPVGENLQDHIAVEINYKLDRGIGINLGSIQDPEVLQSYAISKSGPLASPYGAEVGLFVALSKEDKLRDMPTLQLEAINFPSFSDALRAQNYNKQSIEELAGRDQFPDGFQILGVLIRPESRGRICLKSNNHLDHPSITTNYLQNTKDVDSLMEAINITQQIAEAPSLKSIGAARTEDFTYTPCKRYRYNTREFWECQVRSRPLSIWHPVGTCKMGPRGDKTAVVDSQLRVQGIQGLRVVDASIMPWITSCNTNAPVIMIAEKAADIIKGLKPLEPTDL